MSFKELRETKNKSMAQMSEAIGLSKSTWNNWESGRSEPTIDGLRAVCKRFKVHAVISEGAIDFQKTTI